MKGVKRDTDTTLGWVERRYPQLSAWRVLATEWLKGETRGVADRLNALAVFFERYLIRNGLPLDPALFLAKNSILPDFYRDACPDSTAGVKYNNYIHNFIHYVLLREFSEPADDGQSVVSPAFRNPVQRMSFNGLPRREQSVYSPLPYGYIDELRRMLATGPHFRDWKWAQSCQNAESTLQSRRAPDWFKVAENEIDRNDPNCVWRVREASDQHGEKQIFEMWSPVAWVALLIKLILPLRTFQVRMLDSGEADTWRFTKGDWELNSSQLTQGSERKPLQQGVFRRRASFEGGIGISTSLYINTNKTADIAKSGSQKGYLLPWSFGGPVHQDAYYWLEALRNWQEKYNPIPRRTRWAELDGRHIKAKSDVQLASYPDICFLFRSPTADQRHLPISRFAILESRWFRMLEELEQRLVSRGETHRDGSPIRFLPPPENQNHGLTTLFPLHSLRVSLITALALEGQVPFPILQKLVGHSRLLMTLYYTKPGASYIDEILVGAAERLEANKESSIQSFLLNTAHEDLLQKAICNNIPSLSASIPRHPASRNPVGWMPMHHGLCLVGGNTSEIEDNSAVGGCYNGGPNVGTPAAPKYSHVQGGSRNCVRCRWFVTEPHYLPALAGHFNTLAYHFDEARNACLSKENSLQDLKKLKVDMEDDGQPFTQMGAYREAERLWESAMKRFSDLAEDLVACWRLIERCKAALVASQDGIKVVAAGTMMDLHIAFEETESELLQLINVCESTEIYPDLDPGKAIFRRSQLLDAVLYRENVPPMFMLLSEHEQLLAGNAFVRHLARQMNPANPGLGQREVIHLMDAGVSLSQYFDLDLTSLLPAKSCAQSFFAGHQTIKVGDV